ncbi:response regulator [Rhizobium sp. Root149]|uniref:CheY-like chemotaxis protein n=1 Tax=Rhizobium rhizoryzae TaxID=451876 RepID=A0A7W6LK19_9HYPH|nr:MULTISPECIES: response regulator [Rhizobium]KQZ49412.1 response regulator [Rhizobium sp. Root149]MBB4144788.1 CheY-like chemotaxis protein [Rhizobium rhizoryzae]
MSAQVMRRRLEDTAMNQRVLIVEDEFLIALDIAETIEEMGLTVAGFASGRDHALALAPHADIAFVDVNLSDGATGPSIGRELAERFGITVVFMTANPEQLEGQDVRPLGVLTKPVMPHILQDTVSYAIANRIGSIAAMPQQLRTLTAANR